LVSAIVAPETVALAPTLLELITLLATVITAPFAEARTPFEAVYFAAAVFEIASAKVLHGAVRLHGLASLPTPETQVRVCACAGAAPAPSDSTVATPASESKMRRNPGAAFPLDIRVITCPPSLRDLYI